MAGLLFVLPDGGAAFRVEAGAPSTLTVGGAAATGEGRAALGLALE